MHGHFLEFKLKVSMQKGAIYESNFSFKEEKREFWHDVVNKKPQGHNCFHPIEYNQAILHLLHRTIQRQHRIEQNKQIWMQLFN